MTATKKKLLNPLMVLTFTSLCLVITIYFLCLFISKLQTPFILLNGDDLNPLFSNCLILFDITKPLFDLTFRK